jgi:hypothetical protein
LPTKLVAEVDIISSFKVDRIFLALTRHIATLLLRYVLLSHGEEWKEDQVESE